MAETIDFKTKLREVQKPTQEPDSRIVDLLTDLVERTSVCQIEELIVGYLNTTTGNYETHVIPHSDIAMANLGCDLLKKQVLSLLETDEDEET